MEKNLIQSSKRLILWNQHRSGGYIACPLFANYAYSWLRDGTFIAYAMDVSGEHQSSAAFYDWVNGVLSRKQQQVKTLLQKKADGRWIDRNEFLNTRYHLDGRDDDAEWGHFQLDGYGAWLWGLVEHSKRNGLKELPSRYRQAVELTVDYITAFWSWPNFDCWEENPDFVHPSTLACLYGGLKAVGELENRQELLNTAAEIKKFISDNCVEQGRFAKSVVHREGRWQAVLPGVDANLMWLTMPFGVFEAEDSIMKSTLESIRQELVADGGVHRYKADTYYGGGAWILLTAWYGWVLAELGQTAEARRCMAWIEQQADSLDRLPEQVPAALHDEHAYQDWIRRWGEPALPLLWSHAMYLVLADRLSRA